MHWLSTNIHSDFRVKRWHVLSFTLPGSHHLALAQCTLKVHGDSIHAKACRDLQGVTVSAIKYMKTLKEILSIRP